MKSKYTVYKRSKSPYYQVQFLNDDGTLGVQKSSGKKNKADAKHWADEQLEQGLVSTVKTDIVTLDDLGSNFFDFDGAWARDRRTSGYRLSEQQCYNKQQIYRNYIHPFMGHMKLVDINNALLDKFRDHLLHHCKTITTGKPLTGSTINKIMSTLSTIIGHASRKEYIKRSPAPKRVSPSLHKKTRSALHHNDIIKLFENMNQWKYIRPQNKDPDYKNFGKERKLRNDRLDAENLRAYTLCYLAWKTGMRESELQGLTHDCLDFKETGETIITIQRSWSKFSKKMNETTKTGKTGAAPVGKRGTELIKAVMAQNPYGTKPSGFLFYGSDRSLPISRESIRRPLLNALKRSLGIKDPKAFTLHCFRHQANSEYLAAGLSGDRIHSVLRHETPEMTMNYSHDIGEYRDILEAQEKMEKPI